MAEQKYTHGWYLNVENYQSGMVYRLAHSTANEEARVGFPVPANDFTMVEPPSVENQDVTWNDILLRWKPEDFGGVDHVRVPSDYIWTPDIVLYNYADIRLTEKREALAVVDKTGQVLWIPMGIYKSTCSIDITHFPFDEQTCHMKFGSWTYDGYKVDLDFYDGMDEVDVNDYIESNEWVLVEHPAVRNVKRYPCCDEPYIDLTFTMKVKRMGAFYSYILILPCVLLSSITLVIFWLPPESSAKMILGMNIFVAFFLLLRILSDSTPPASSSVPLIGAYFGLNMVLITLSTFLSVVVINLYFRGDKRTRVPLCMRRVFIDGLARWVFMRGDFPAKMNRENERRMEHHTISIDSRRKSGKEKQRLKIKSPILTYNKWEPPSANNHRADSPVQARYQTPDRSPIHDVAMESEVKEIRRALRSFMARLQEKDALAKVMMEWRIVALVLDRIFFCAYLVIIIISLCTIFPKG